MKSLECPHDSQTIVERVGLQDKENLIKNRKLSHKNLLANLATMALGTKLIPRGFHRSLDTEFVGCNFAVLINSWFIIASYRWLHGAWLHFRRARVGVCV